MRVGVPPACPPALREVARAREAGKSGHMKIWAHENLYIWSIKIWAHKHSHTHFTKPMLSAASIPPPPQVTRTKKTRHQQLGPPRPFPNGGHYLLSPGHPLLYSHPHLTHQDIVWAWASTCTGPGHQTTTARIW